MAGLRDHLFFASALKRRDHAWVLPVRLRCARRGCGKFIAKRGNAAPKEVP